jgi:hypothetical protein
MGLTLAEYEAREPEAPACQVWHVTCAECDVLFIARHGNQVICSGECRRKRNSRITSEGIMARYYADPEFRDLVISQAHNRNVGKLGLPGITQPTHLVAFLLDRDGGICQLCQEPVTELDGPWKPSIDHIIPLSRCEELGVPEDKRHVIENLWLAHFRCNLAKNNDLPDPGVIEIVLTALGLAKLTA